MSHISESKGTIEASIYPGALNNLICFWDFQSAGRGGFRAVSGEPYKLRPRPGAARSIEGGLFGRYALEFRKGFWLECPRHQCPALDIHGPGAQLSVIAWIRWQRPARCQFLAGMWDETNRARQYGLFLNLSGRFNSRHNAHAHVSSVGTPTGNDPCCTTYATGKTVLKLDQWYTIAMSYDGKVAKVYLNGTLDENNPKDSALGSLNPYYYGKDLFDGGREGADFTVGAVDTGGQMKNWFHGQMAGLAVYNRALSDEEMAGLSGF